MIKTNLYNPPITLVARNCPHGLLELSRLMAAAVINPGFRHLLLDDPELALAGGFQGEEFLFTEEERDLILSIRTDSLVDLANQLNRTFNDRLPLFIDHSVQPGIGVRV